MAEAVKKEEVKKKGIFSKIKESVDDKEEQLAFLSTIVRLAVLVWSAGILTLAYVKLPAAFNIPEQKLDPTFIASVFTGTLATFGVQAAGKKKNSADGGGANARNGHAPALPSRGRGLRPSAPRRPIPE